MAKPAHLRGNLENIRCLLNLADLANHPRRGLVLRELIHNSYDYSTVGHKSR